MTMTSTAQSTPTTSEGTQVLTIPVENLFLDEENPRLASLDGNATQKDLLRVLWNEMAVDEVALSIAANGYWKEEPLFVIPKTKETDPLKRKYIVVEGNRRLAAVKLLRDASLQKDLEADLPKLSAGDRHKLDTLPVSVYATRKELWKYFGFRHINGPKPWDAFAKAKYVADVREQYKVTLDDIADSIGDRHATVKRLYRGYKILVQAEAKAHFDREDIVRNRFFFSHLYTAADQPEFQKFLGITAEGSLRPNPVPASRLKHLREFMLWLYGSKAKEVAPVVRTQNPDLNVLRDVIADSRGLSALRAGLSLERAREISIGDDSRFREALTRAKEDLLQAKATVTTGFSGSVDLLELVADILQVANSIQREMEASRKSGARASR
jgi:hypothetical protein